MKKDIAKTIVCYGDSNTWGNIPRSSLRYPRSVRWPAVLQNLLGDTYEVISEGLPGRTFTAMEPHKPYRTGINQLPSILESADPIDLVIIMLGTNDIKNMFNLSAEQIVQGLEDTIQLIKGGTLDLECIPQILVICPPAVIAPEKPAISEMGKSLDSSMERGIELFKILPNLYKRTADLYGCLFINAGDYIESSRADGYHMDEQAHIKLAEVVADLIKDVFVS
jgi:lysophospholipase L1-like esterase